MRAVAMLIVAGLSGIGAAWAQGPLDGPLSAPDTASPATLSKPIKTRKSVHPKTAHQSRTKKPAPDAADADASGHDVPVARRTTDDNPLSLGMKWNGSNDNASQTRVQNYGGDAAGTGAAVGLKLHF